jgi:hypothetical protein
MSGPQMTEADKTEEWTVIQGKIMWQLMDLLLKFMKENKRLKEKIK